MKQCSIIVFGDIGRSPRMVNHALAIADNTEYRINFYGYLDNKPTQALLSNPNIRIVDLNLWIVNLLKKMPRFLFLLYAILRIALQSLYLFLLLLFSRKQEFILVQNPPSIPVLHVVSLIKGIRRSKIIIDFHNYGHTILALQMRNKFILKMARSYEHQFSRSYDYALCVSQAMQKDLQQNWRINATVVYDKANINFNVINKPKEKHELFMKLDFHWQWEVLNSYETLFTEELNNQQVIEKVNRPGLIVSSTSWTKDEDFNILVQALQKYEDLANIEQGREYRKLYVVITGKGPMKDEFKEIFQKCNICWNHVKVNLAWLDIDDYPKLLGCADLGICLHYSSSGLDLPMKVVDMFGAGTPVFAKSFNAISELVQHQKNGIVFDTPDDLFDHLSQAFRYESNILQKLKNGVETFRTETFDQEWRNKVLPFIRNLK
ncbi:unnamed protein product [Paramecium primaurelia]|uniref:Beta-1,4-mannosyltransferase n=1 Tax=Paramecium primaurelia TaxID=5886 RepID=A0A8S1NM78_PARPR|nr:unnamed protein product [Paramecium primaurelia]